MRREEATPRLLAVYAALLSRYGERHWWPAETPFEVVVGAILTQNTAWSNVERAVAALKHAGVLSAAGVARLPIEELQALIRPAGFFRQKAQRLQTLACHLLQHYQGEVQPWLAGDLAATRRELLAFSGIGPETADSILLYAGSRPSFVVDAYTRRLFSRLGLLQGDEGYDVVRGWFMAHLPHAVALFNEYHALIVEHCKTRCRKAKPLCQDCPLQPQCPATSRLLAVQPTTVRARRSRPRR